MSYNKLRKGRFSEPGQEYFITFTVHNRRPVFSDFHLARAFIQVLANTSDKYNSKWLAWVLMPDHYHGLIQLSEGENLSTIIKKLKGTSAQVLNNGSGQSFWQANFHDRALRRGENQIQVARYIIANPLRAGLVSRIGDYPHWDCVWL